MTDKWSEFSTIAGPTVANIICKKKVNPTINVPFIKEWFFVRRKKFDIFSFIMFGFNSSEVSFSKKHNIFIKINKVKVKLRKKHECHPKYCTKYEPMKGLNIIPAL